MMKGVWLEGSKREHLVEIEAYEQFGEARGSRRASGKEKKGGDDKRRPLDFSEKRR